jgi:hypothetical protein
VIEGDEDCDGTELGGVECCRCVGNSCVGATLLQDGACV